MTIFQHRLKQLLTGQKTETSRITCAVSDGTGKAGHEVIRYPGGKKTMCRLGEDRLGNPRWLKVWQVGQAYAIQPGRGIHSVGRYKVLDVWLQDVRTVSTAQIKAEGFWNKDTRGEEGYYHFMRTWIAMYDRQFEFRFDPSLVDYRVREGRIHDITSWGTVKQMIENRPAERYLAWRMSIAVHWESVDWEAPAVKALQIPKFALS